MLYIGPGFCPKTALAVPELACRHIVTVDIPHEPEIPSGVRFALLRDTVEALRFGKYLSELSPVALDRRGVQDVKEHFYSEGGALLGFSRAVIPHAYSHSMANLRDLIDVISYVPKLSIDHGPDTLPLQFQALGSALLALDRALFPKDYRTYSTVLDSGKPQ